MPVSKRAKVVNLTQTKQDRKALKGDLVTMVQENVDKYDYIYILNFENIRTNFFKELRNEWSHSRFLMGKNKVIQIALRPDGEAYREGLDDLADDVSGNISLLFTDKKPTEVKAFFETYGVPDYPRSGFIPEEDIVIPAGRLEEWPHTMLDTFRKLNMPVRLDKGIIVLTDDFVACRADTPITPEQGRILKYFGHQLASFRADVLSVWSAKKKTVTRFEVVKKSKYENPGDDINMEEDE